MMRVLRTSELVPVAIGICMSVVNRCLNGDRIACGIDTVDPRTGIGVGRNARIFWNRFACIDTRLRRSFCCICETLIGSAMTLTRACCRNGRFGDVVGNSLNESAESCDSGVDAAKFSIRTAPSETCHADQLPAF
jgi:hypothetical protein